MSIARCNPEEKVTERTEKPTVPGPQKQQWAGHLLFTQSMKVQTPAQYQVPEPARSGPWHSARGKPLAPQVHPPAKNPDTKPTSTPGLPAVPGTEPRASDTLSSTFCPPCPLTTKAGSQMLRAAVSVSVMERHKQRKSRVRALCKSSPPFNNKDFL